MKRLFVLISLMILSLSNGVLAQEIEATKLLFDAIDSGSVKLAKRAIKRGADINSVNVDGKAPYTTVIAQAARQNRNEILELLILNNVNVNQTTPVTGLSALMIAAQNNNMDMAKKLIDAGANPNLLSVWGERSALIYTALHQSRDVARLLVEVPALDINLRGKLCALAVASRQGDLEIVQTILSKKDEKKLNSVCLESAKNMASINQHPSVIEVLNQVVINE